MDKEEAKMILKQELSKYLTRSRSDLIELVNNPVSVEVTTESGKWYTVTIEASWDREPHGDLRVVGAVGDGGWRQFIPICEDFLVKPDGTR